MRRSSWFNLLRHVVKDKLLPPTVFQCPITVIKLTIWLPLKSVHHLHLFSPRQRLFGDGDLGSFCLLGLILLIIAVLLWIDHSARLVLCRFFIAFMYNHVSAFFLRRCVKTTVFKTWKVVCVCFPVVYSLLFSSTHIYHQKVQGCNGWAHLGVWRVAHWFTVTVDPASVVQYRLHQQMTPPGKWMGPLFFWSLFQNENKEICSFAILFS